MANEEQVLVIPTRVLHEAGLFQGLCRDVERYAPTLLDARHFSFLPRSKAEDDPNFKQLIPYVVLKFEDQVFHYRRGQGAGEKRLRALRSIGIGGHINPIDHSLTSPSGRGVDPCLSSPLGRGVDPCLPSPLGRGVGGEGVHPYRQGMLREIEEEVDIATKYHETCLGFINDDSTPVGQVHLGIVHVFELESPNVERREPDVMDAGFASIHELAKDKNGFETWSQFVLIELVELLAKGKK